MSAAEDLEILVKYVRKLLQDEFPGRGYGREQKELSEKSGVARGSISQFLNGLSTYPEIPSLGAFLDALEIPLVKAIEAAKKWDKDRLKDEPISGTETANMRTAIAALANEDPPITISSAVRALAFQTPGDLSVDAWKEFFRSAMVMEVSGALARMIAGGQEARAKRRGRGRPRGTSSQSKSAKDR